MTDDDKKDTDDELFQIEDPLKIVERLDASDSQDIIVKLTVEEAQTVVDRLKAGADKYWGINPNRSLEMANIIIKIADVRNNLSHKALGLMARGDALKLLGNSQEAWDTLGEAGELYLQIGDEIGWARTRIGRIALCAFLDRGMEALQEGEQARAIFIQSNANDFLLRLDFNTAWINYIRGDHEQALRWYQSAHDIANSAGNKEQQFLGLIYLNIGIVYCELLGDFQTSLYYFDKAYSFAVEHDDMANIALSQLNMAYVAKERGQYLRALYLLHQAGYTYKNGDLPWDANHVNHEIVGCYISLNRFVEARDLAQDVIAKLHSYGEAYKEAHTLLFLATAEAELSDFDAALEALNVAETLFINLDSKVWAAVTQLRRAQIILKLGDSLTAQNIVSNVTGFFETSKQQLNYARAVLLEAEVILSTNDLDAAATSSRIALNIAQYINVPLIRYKAHLLLGKVAEKKGNYLHAIRRYQAAMFTIERVQQALTISFKSEFSEDKTEATHSLIALYLRNNGVNESIELLERGKSQIFFNYISNRQLLRWPKDDPKCRELIQELDQLRGEHHWWYQNAHVEIQEDQKPPNMISQEEALKEITIRERRMREITEQLYIQGSANSLLLPTTMPHLSDIQKCLDKETLLIQLYQNGDSVWVFTIDNVNRTAYSLPVPMKKIEQDLRFLHFNIDTVLSAQADMPQSAVRTIREQRLLHQLYNALLAPFASELRMYTRLIFVPYSSLHYLPFHLLHDGSSYLIEHYEVIVQPAAGYVTQRGPQRSGGARAIAHSRGGALPHSPDEARFVHELFGGTMVQDDGARRSVLENPPVQILHIAAHAEYRPQQPDLSYIELADGHLLTDDLLQQDMSYELVTLSACETARAHVAASDELIGLGRGFLYAGAGALVASLWRVADDMTLRLMEHFYRELHAGASKSVALRNAQLAILRQDPQLHPAFWGAFQLVGDPGPLSTQSGPQKSKHKR